MPNDWEPISYQPIGGVNTEDNSSMIGETEVSASTNFLYERAQALTRPGLNARTLTGTPLGGTVADADSLRSAGVAYNLLIDSLNNIYQATSIAFTLVVATTPLAGFQGPLGLTTLFKPVSVNGVVLIGGSAGILQWTPGVGTTTITTAKPAFITSHLTRAVGAYDVGVAAPAGPITVEWSRAGDQTTWNTNPSTDGSGKTVLADAPDTLTGLVTLHNIVVVCRSSGFHLGTPTGQAIPAFSFQLWSRDTSGVFFPRTLAVYDNIAYFVSKDDIYTFDLNRTTSIGYKVRSKLLADLYANASYRGFITTRQRSGEMRLRYHVFPNNGAGSHYIYDIHDGTWSVHSYSMTPGPGFSFLESLAQEGPAFYDNGTTSPKVEAWDSTVAVDTAASFTGKTWWPLGVNTEASVHKTVMTGLDQGVQPSPVSLTLSGRVAVSGQDTLKTYTAQATYGSTGSGDWTRRVFRINEVVGGPVKLFVSVPAGTKHTTDMVQIYVSPSGEIRG